MKRLMNGIYVEKIQDKKQVYWAVKDCVTHRVLSVGATANIAVKAYEIMRENEAMEAKLGVSSEETDRI